jgi:hypothetical protein
MPFLARAAEAAWGPEIAYLLILHLLEAEILANVHYQQVGELAERCMQDKRRPRPAHSSNCSVMGYVIPEKKFTGKFRGGDTDAKFPSPLLILACRHTNGIVQPDKALKSYIGNQNFGVGLIFVENTKECTKVIFQGRSLPNSYWNALVEHLQRLEPNVWYRPQPFTPFLLNGNAAHQYVPVSRLSAYQLSQICRKLPVGRSP